MDEKHICSSTWIELFQDPMLNLDTYPPQTIDLTLKSFRPWTIAKLTKVNYIFINIF